MTMDLRVRPQLVFAATVAALIAGETAILASRAFLSHERAFSLAVALDFALVLPLAAWWTGTLRPWRAAMLGLAIAGVLVPGGSVTLIKRLAVPGEIIFLGLLIRTLSRSRGDLSERLRATLGDGFAARALATEATLLWYGVFSWPTKPPDGFTLHRRAGWVAIDAALVLCVIAEAIPLHFLLPRPWNWIMTSLHGYSLLWLLGDLQALRLRPTTVEGGMLKLRVGMRWEAAIPLATIASVERPVAAPDRAAVFHASVIGSPNLVLRFTRPQVMRGLLGIERRCDALALCADEPEALARAIQPATGTSSI